LKNERVGKKPKQKRKSKGPLDTDWVMKGGSRGWRRSVSKSQTTKNWPGNYSVAKAGLGKKDNLKGTLGTETKRKNRGWKGGGLRTRRKKSKKTQKKNQCVVCGFFVV